MTLQTLTVRTTAALGRLADLQRRAEQGSGTSIPVVKPALKELGAALEELQVANEQLQDHVNQLAGARTRTDDLMRRFEEFVRVMPLACIWTDAAGMILDVNDTAAQLLNVARPRLPGKPLMLFLADRQRFFDALAALNAPDGGAVELDLIVRPRERRPRAAQVTARALEEDPRWCWFIQPWVDRAAADADEPER
jgi:PAS domain-containing protein